MTSPVLDRDRDAEALQLPRSYLPLEPRSGRMDAFNQAVRWLTSLPLVGLVVLWLLTIVGGFVLVLFAFGPFFQQRDQHHLLGAYSKAIERAANESTGLGGVTVPTKAPELGAPVAVVELPTEKFQQVAIEGTRAGDTRRAIGHVSGTAGPGQPGNSVLVGRRAAFGAPFGSIHTLRKGAAIVVTTTQGQSLYHVVSVKHVRLTSSRIDKIYGPSPDDRLTLVTSASASLWNSSSASVVVAKMEGKPFAPTPQGARRSSDTGTHGDGGALPAVILALVFYAGVLVGGVILYRRLRPGTAYVLSIGPVIAFTIIAAETVVRLFPAWL